MMESGITFNLRESLIEMHAIRNADVPYSMYFDETNNLPKLRLNEGRFNVSDNACFALGGVASLNSTSELPLAFLIDLLEVQSNVSELKLKHIGKGNFVEIIASNRVKKFLDWLISQNYLVHYQIIDPLYWGIVDIIDTIDIDAKPEILFFLSQNAKTNLHRVIQNNLPETEHIFSKFEYPNISNENITAFYTALVNMVNTSHCLEPFNKKMLCDILMKGSNLKTLSVLGGEEKSTLLDSFDKFYAERIMLFKNAKLIFDDEGNIPKKLQDQVYAEMIGTNDNYAFVDSKLNTHIQISDLIIGLIGKYFSYLNANSTEDVIEFLQNLTSIQSHNMSALNTLTNRSHQQCNAFFHYVVSGHLHDKNRQVWNYIG